MKALPLLYLEWLDASVITQGDWLSFDEIMEDAQSAKFLNRTVGWLLWENDNALVVTAQIAVDQVKPMHDLVMFIPKALVRKRKVLKV